MRRVQSWNNNLLLITCVMALLVDPIFFYIPQIDAKQKCLVLDRPLKITTCALRTFLDLFYIILHVMLQFQAGFIVPSLGVFGPRARLVVDPWAVAKRYLSSKFIIDILSVIPLPQVVVLVIMPIVNSSSVPLIEKEWVKYIVLVQYVPRILRLYPFFRVVTRTSGILTEKLWIAAAYNLLLYMLASHVVGSVWYILSVESEIRCWTQGLKNANIYGTTYMSCGYQNSTVLSLLNNSCPFKNPDEIDDPSVFNFGIFIDALRSRVVESTTNFPHKIFYCLWWGLRNVSSLGQDLKTSTFIEEIFFTIFIAIFGLILFALLIGNVQKYLQSMQSTAVRAEEMRVKRQNMEKWMTQRMLPEHLKERIRKYEHYKWQQHEGVDEETLIKNLPKDLRGCVKRYLYLDFIKRVSVIFNNLSIKEDTRVPMFETMDEQLLDALCDGMKRVLHTEKSAIIREGQPVDQMLFFMRGNLESRTTTGFFNSCVLEEGDFCGEELFAWALDPNSSSNLPISTRTVESLSEVEAFALMANDLKLVASQFRRLLNNYIQRTFKYFSLQWRTWAACFIQAAWRRYRKWKILKSLREAEDSLQDALTKEEGSSVSFGDTIHAARFAANASRSLRKSNGKRKNNRMPYRLLPQKPTEPDFTTKI